MQMFERMAENKRRIVATVAMVHVFIAFGVCFVAVKVVYVLVISVSVWVFRFLG